MQRVGESPTGIDAWECATCGDFKRWCPECDQGWVRRFRLEGTDVQPYSCDECEAAWLLLTHIGTPGIDRRSLVRQLGNPEAASRFELVREHRPVPPAA